MLPAFGSEILTVDSRHFPDADRADIP